MSVQSSTTPSTTPATRPSGAAAPAFVDPRGQRFAASITTVVLAIALLTAPSTATVVLLSAQLACFAAGVLLGPARTPYAWVFRTFVRPRLAPPTELEDVRPARFAQTVGLAFAVVAVLGYAAGLPVLGAVAAGMALGAAFLNAAFGYCLGCEMYLLLVRLTSRTQPA